MTTTQEPNKYFHVSKGTFPEVLRYASSKYENMNALSTWQKSDTVTYSQFASRVRSFSSFLVENGAQKGDKVAIIGLSCPNWAISFFG
ncbi:MAG: AMP-binding protein, partial [Sphaerochaetaceae bacterium]|nr:AMP-binding protein [Sphaerochaetaceae bacterium]